MRPFRSVFAPIALVATLAAAAAPTFAADVYKVIMPFAAGGATEVLARMIAHHMQAATGDAFVVENVVGANGNIGATAAARAAPDGKTMLITSEAFATVNPLLFKTGMNYKPSDLDPIMLIAVQPAVLAVRADSPIKTFEDLMRKAKTEGISYSSAGIGSTSHLMMSYLNSLAGGTLKLTHVPYTGGAPAINAIMGGVVDAGFIVAGNVLPHVRGGKLVALAVAGDKRLSQLPNVRSMSEVGFPGLEANNAAVLAVPARTPDAVKQRLYTEAKKAAEAQDVRTYLENNGYFLRASTPADSRKWLEREAATWTDLIEKKQILKE